MKSFIHKIHKNIKLSKELPPWRDPREIHTMKVSGEENNGSAVPMTKKKIGERYIRKN